jgi:uncharacterized protein YecA (UPF0149 family)
LPCPPSGVLTGEEFMNLFKSIANMFSFEEEETGDRNLGRNESCWCGSGKKYKKCHLIEDEKKADKKAAACCVKS